MMLKHAAAATALLVSLSAATSSAQTPKSSAQAPKRLADSPQRMAERELASVLTEASAVTDKLSYAKVRATGLALSWRADPEGARKSFRELWAWAGAQDDRDFAREEARMVILKALFTRDAKLASELLKEAQTGETTGDSSAAARRLNDLAASLIESDPATAAGLLEQSLGAGFSPANVALLSDLRKKDAALADGVAGHVLDAQRSAPTSSALPALYALTEYVFPARRTAFGGRYGGESLRQRFFSTAGEVLAGVLQDAGRRPGEATAGADFEGFYEAHLATLLAPLAKSYAPEHAAEFQETAARLLAALPPQQAELARYAAGRISGDEPPRGPSARVADISTAIKDGDFDEARRLLGGVEREEARKFFDYQITTGEFKAVLAKSDLSRALFIARGVESPQARAYMLAQVARAAYDKDDVEMTSLVLSEARATLAALQCSEKSALTTFFIASGAALLSYDDSLELLNSGVTCVNSLGSNSAGSSASGDSAESAYARALQQAFSAVGRRKLSEALAAAGRIENRPVRLLAKLAAVEPWLGAAQGQKPERRDAVGKGGRAQR